MQNTERRQLQSKTKPLLIHFNDLPDYIAALGLYRLRARDMSISHSTLSRLANRITQPTVYTLQEIERSYNIRVIL